MLPRAVKNFCHWCCFLSDGHFVNGFLRYPTSTSSTHRMSHHDDGAVLLSPLSSVPSHDPHLARISSAIAVERPLGLDGK